MNQINELFNSRSGNIFSVYFTAGYPTLTDTIPILQGLIRHGADLIEIGMPYSDPVADGPVIERCSAQALKNGMSIARLFEQLRNFKPEKPVPLVLMGYLNPVMQYGYERFCADAKACGVSGLILPDLPIEEYERELKPHMEKHGLHFIFLITPETPEDRIRHIDLISTGFIYAVSSSSVTGRETDEHKKEGYMQRLQSYELKNPLMVGFGIRDHKTFAQACRYTRGGITGTVFMNAISENKNLDEAIATFIQNMKQG